MSMSKIILAAVCLCFINSVAFGACTPVNESCSACPVTYSCNSGYYGTAVSASFGCTACPAFATCAGGNGSTFSCNAGYFKDGAGCASCATATGNNSATSAAGAAAITDCYLPKGTTGSDSTGSYAIDAGDCYYTK